MLWLDCVCVWVCGRVCVCVLCMSVAKPVNQSHSTPEQFNKPSWLSAKYSECVWAVRFVGVSQREEGWAQMFFFLYRQREGQAGLWSSEFGLLSQHHQEHKLLLNSTTFSWLSCRASQIFLSACLIFFSSSICNVEDMLLHVWANVLRAWHVWRVQSQDSVCSRPWLARL